MDRCMFINVPWIKQHNPLHYEHVHIRTEPHHPWEIFLVPFTTQTLAYIAYKATQQGLQLSCLHEHESPRLLYVRSQCLLLLCKCIVLGLRSTIYECTWSFQVFGTKGAMSLIYTEIRNIVVYPDRHIRSYLHNSQAQLLLMAMYVENTVGNWNKVFI